MPYLHVSNDASPDLSGSIDTAGQLDIAYGTTQLSDYEDKLFVDHDDSSVAQIRVILHDLTDLTGSWKMSAIHGQQAWPAGKNCVYFDFEWLTDYVAVSVTATNTATRATKTKLLRIKTQPQGSLPGDTMFVENTVL